MSFWDKVINFLPFGGKVEEQEYFFALNIGQKTLDAALWMLDGKNLQILQSSKDEYSSLDEITTVTDRLLDKVLTNYEIEPQKILFGVPDHWLSEDDLKDEYLKLLRRVVKELEVTPMAYVATSHALIHFLESIEGVPTTAILVGFEKEDLVVTVTRAGKLDGSKVVKRSDSPGLDIEKALLTFTSVETLPSKILIYGQIQEKLEKLKSELLSFAWMSKLSFLHFPKIDLLEYDIEIRSICFAGAKEIKPDATFIPMEGSPQKITKKLKDTEIQQEYDNLGFVVGDVSQMQKEEEAQELIEEDSKHLSLFGLLKTLKRISPKVKLRRLPIWVGLGVFILLILSYLLLPKAQVKIFIEPQILEKDAEVTADPKIKVVDEEAKIIPGQIVETEVSGSGKGNATGKKEIGDPSKGSVIIYNKTYDSKTLSKGTSLTSPNGIKFSLDTSVNIASQSATDSGIIFGKANAQVTAQVFGADGNLPSGTELSVANIPTSQITAKAEGNFSGGTSKQVTVVSENDQSRLLAQLAADLRRGAQQKIQENYKDKKILEEALSEEIIKKSFSKNVNDQASEFSLNLNVRFRGTAFEDKDLRLIVSKLVNTQVPEGFELNLEETETQADVSKLEKDGKLIFLARFRAKLMPRLDLEKIKSQIKGKTPKQVDETLKQYQYILGSQVQLKPMLPFPLKRLPFLERNISLEVGLK